MDDLSRTRLHLVGLAGDSRRVRGGYLLRSPLAPHYFHGNGIALDEAPSSLTELRALWRETHGDRPDFELFVWSGPAPTQDLLDESRRAGFDYERSVALALEEVPPKSGSWVVRALEAEDEPSIDRLARESDGSWGSGADPGYDVFREELACMQRRWRADLAARWWGAFDGERLVGQCGLVVCDSEVGAGLGRFQSVEVHPAWRRRGVATALVAAVARDALTRCQRVLLEADGHGPAIGLYERLGFERDGEVHALLRSPTPLQVRDEGDGDRAEVDALIAAAFENHDEVQLVRALREVEGAYSLVAVRDGQLLGHIAFSRCEVTPPDGSAAWSAYALAPLAVRPDAQRRGVGAQLVRSGLARLEAGGHDTCFVLGSPDYYGRFGFEAARPRGFTCRWPAPEGAFQVRRRQGDARPGGPVAYGSVFDDL